MAGAPSVECDVGLEVIRNQCDILSALLDSVLICSLTKTTAISSTTLTFLTWTFYINSGLNPIVYALFYHWFKISVKHILTL